MGESEHITETTSKMVSTRELDAVLDSIMDSALALFQIQQVCFIMMDPDGYLRMKRHRGFSEEFVRSIQGRPGEGFYGKVYQSGEPILITDARKQLDPDTAKAVLQEGLTSFVHVPVKIKGETVAVLNMTSLQDEHRFDEGDLEQLSTFADQAAIAIENAQLYAESQQRLQAQRRLARIAVLASSTLDIDELLAQLVQETAQLTEAQTAVLLLLDEEKQALVGRYLSTEGRLVSAPGGRVPLDAPGFEQSIFARGDVYYTNHAQTDPNILPAYRPYIEALNAENFCGIALRVRDRSIGELYVVNRSGGFGPEQLQLLRTATGYVANAIENARLFLGREQRITELVTINEMSQALSSALTMDDLLETVYQHVNRRFDATNFYIATYEEASEEWTAVFDQEHGQRLPRTRYKVQAGVTGHIIRTGQPVLFRTQQEGMDFEKEQGIEPLGPQSKSWMGIPLIAAGKVVGVMAIQSYEQEHLYNEQDVALFSTIGAQAAVAIENLRLLEETRRRARQLETITEIGQAVTSVLDLDAVLRQIVDTIKARFGFYFISILLVEGEQLVFRDGSPIGDSDARLERRERVFDLQQPSLIIEVARTGQPVLVSDVLSDPRYLAVPELAATRSELDVPIEVKGRVIGVLDVQSDQPDAFDQADMALLQSLASQAGIAIENARLFQAHERRITEQAIVNEIGQAVSSALELDELLETVHRQVGRLFDATNFYIAAYHEEADEWAMLLHLEHGEPQPNVRRKVQAGLTGYIIRNRQPILLRSIEENNAFHEAQEVEPIGEWARSWMGVPLTAADRVVGVMAIQSYEQENLYGESDLALFSTIADQVATALASLRLLGETRRRVSEVQLLHDVGMAVASGARLEEALQAAVEAVAAELGFPIVGIELLDREARALRVRASVGYPPEVIMDAPMPLGEGVTGWVAQHGEPLLVPDVHLDLRYIETVPETRSELCVPLITGSQVIGVLNVESPQPRAFTDDDLRLLSTLASSLSALVERARLFEETRHHAEELAVLNELARALTARLNVNQVLQEAYRGASRLTDASNFYIGLYDPERHEIEFAFDVTGSERNGRIATLPADQGLAGYIVRNRTSVLLEDNVRERQEAMGIEMVGEESLSWLGVPLMLGDRVLGVMAAQSYDTPHAYDEHDRDMLVAIASEVAIAVQNARLFEETQARARELAVLNEMSRDLTAMLDVEAVIERLYQYTDRLMDTTNCYVALYDPAIDGVSFPLAIEEGQRVQWRSRQAGQGLTEYLIRTCEALLIEENIGQRLEELGVESIGRNAASWLGVPLMVGEQVFGVLALQSYTTPRLYGEHHRELLTAVASQAAIALQNARLFEQTQDRARELAVLNEMSRDLAMKLEVDAALESAHRHVSRLMDATNFYVALYDAQQDEISFPFYAEEEEIRRVGSRRSGKGMTEHVIRSRKPLLIKENVTAQLEGLGIELIGQESESWLGVPLMIGDRVTGVVAVQSYTSPRLYDERHRDLLSAVASQLAIAIENARLFEETQQSSFLLGERVKELDCLNDIGRKIDEAPPIPEFLQWAAERIPAAMQHSDVCVVAIEFEGQVYGAPEAMDLPYQIVQGLRVGGEQVGQVYVAYTERRDFPDAASALLGDIVRRMSGYVESHRLFEETRRRTAELQVLHEIALQLGTELGTAELLRLIVEQAVMLLGAEAGGFYLYDPASNELVFSVAVGYFAEFLGNRIKPGEGLAGQVFRRRQPLAVEDYSAWSGQAAIYRQEPRLQAVLGVPVLGREGVLGVLDIGGGEQKRAFDEHDIWLAELFAAQSAVALENTRLFETTQARAEREQRVRTITGRIRQGRDMEAIMRIALEELGWMLGASTSVARLGTREQLLADQEPPAREARGAEKEGD